MLENKLSPTVRLYCVPRLHLSLHELKDPAYGLLCAATMFQFGYDTGSIGVITVMISFEQEFGQLRDIVRGAIVSSMILASALSGFYSGRLADQISRRNTIAIGAAIFAAGSALEAGSRSLAMLVAGRIVAGIGEGFFIGVTPIWLAEIAPKEQRGRLMSLCAWSICLGVMTGYFVCYGSQRIGSDLAWRVPFIVQAFIGAALSISIPLVLPYSPRWLSAKGRFDEARVVLDKINKAGAEAEKEELLAYARNNTEQKTSFLTIFNKENRWRTLWSCYLQAAQQCSGIDLVLFYAPTLFQQAGLSSQDSSFLASGVTGIVLFVSSFVASFFTDRVGRRTALTGGSLVIGIELTLIGIMYASRTASTIAGRWIIVALIECFVITFSISLATFSRIYIAEISLPHARSHTTSFAIGINQATNFVVALTAPAFLGASASAPYFFYGGISLFTGLLCFIILQETVGQSLEGLASATQQNARFGSKVLRRLATRLGIVEREMEAIELNAIDTDGSQIHTHSSTLTSMLTVRDNI